MNSVCSVCKRDASDLTREDDDDEFTCITTSLRQLP